jgi:hypothetical protein
MIFTIFIKCRDSLFAGEVRANDNLSILTEIILSHIFEIDNDQDIKKY